MIKIAPIWRRRMFIAIGTATVFYLVLCTYLWNILYGIFFAYMVNNAPNAQSAASPWCEPGDWVLETFQPMVSDKAMIKHLQKNKLEMTRVAEMAARSQHVDAVGNYNPASGFNELVDKLNLLSVTRTYSWAERPYSVEEAQISHACVVNIDTVIKPATQAARNEAFIDCRKKDLAMGRGLSIVSIEPWFGKTFAQYFCSTARNSSKGYVYYPGGVPRIENGQLMSTTYYTERYRTFASFPGAELVSTTDIDPRGKTLVARQIDERWFITRY